jgi:DNA polymerase I-like protein with 3'-5' exonuclease and polymerase domains
MDIMENHLAQLEDQLVDTKFNRKANMITTVDVETSWQKTETGGYDPSPFHPDNVLVSVGLHSNYGDEYYFTGHSERVSKGGKARIQEVLSETTLLVGHNIKFDLMWLLESGLEYTGRVYDTMLGEYILNRGIRKSLTLEMSCRRRKIGSKDDRIKEFMDRGISFENIPADIVEEYGKIDVQITRKLFDSQMADFRLPKNKGLLMTVKMMNEFLVVLSNMERNGININLDELNQVEKEYRAEFAYLKQKIDKIVYKQMGDTKINLSSPEQLSWLIYSAKPKDKKEWAKIFNVGIDKNTGKNKKRPQYSRIQFRNLVKDNTETIHKTVASQCMTCHGKGVIKKIKKDGSPFKNYSKCSDCDGDGYIYSSIAKVAGFRQRPRNVYDIAESGFRTDKLTLNKIAAEAEGEFKEFIDAIVRHNAVDTYLNTFVEGLKNFTNERGFLHPKFMQAITATGRLSSRDPNFQNQPRGKTFPIRKVVTSRFKDGKMMEIDFAQLEFRTAVYLAQDKQGMEDIKNKIDVHQYTADIIGVSRQDAKAHTFKPLYGGVTGTEDEKRYYSKFLEKYKDIKTWHEKLQSEAIRFKQISLPTGRQYAFPYAERTPWGGSTYGTQIKNYPVQGFATADIVPLACINIYKLMQEKKVKSLLINTVHDSIVADVYPGEEDVMSEIFNRGTADVIPALKQYYKIDFNVPLDTELKIGYDWLNMEEVK